MMALTLDILMCITMVTIMMTTANARLQSCAFNQVCAVGVRESYYALYCDCEGPTLCPIDDYAYTFNGNFFICGRYRLVEACETHDEVAVVLSPDIATLRCRCVTYERREDGQMYCKDLWYPDPKQYV
uniref:Gsp_51 putative toxin n=1 Tax=Gemmula speciosa TaxID=439592 RepID=A0A098LW59_GEMSP